MRRSGFGGAAFATAEEVDGGAEFEERVGGGLDAVDARDGVEDDLLLLREAVGENAGEFDGAEFDEFAIFGPWMVASSVTSPGAATWTRS